MNTHDRKNLTFLLTASDKDIDAWWNQASPDDQLYALELLAKIALAGLAQEKAANPFAVRSIIDDIEAAAKALHSQAPAPPTPEFSETEKFTEANAVLDKFRI
jgi:hypothetical protein